MATFNLETPRAAMAAQKETLKKRLNGTQSSIVDAASVNMELVEGIGGSNATALGPGMFAEFYAADEYKNNMSDLVTVTKSTSNGRDYYNLYALVEVGRIGSDTKKPALINIGGLVRYHYDIPQGARMKGAKILDAIRELTPGEFNQQLADFQQPWKMLTEFLAGKTIKCSRDETPRYYPRFVNRKRAVDEYVLQKGLKYSFK